MQKLTTYRDLLLEYRIALGLFTGMRTLYPQASTELEVATQYLHELKIALASHPESAFAA